MVPQSGTLLPFFDQDTNMLYLAGKVCACVCVCVCVRVCVCACVCVRVRVL